MVENFPQFHLTTYVVSGLVLLGVYFGLLMVSRTLRNRAEKKRHRLPIDE